MRLDVLTLIVVAPPDAASNKLQGSNVFTIAKRTVEGQDMLYQSMKLTNGIWVLAELRVQAGNPNYAVSTRCGSTTHGDGRQAVIPEARLLFSVTAASFPISPRTRLRRQRKFVGTKVIVIVNC